MMLTNEQIEQCGGPHLLAFLKGHARPSWGYITAFVDAIERAVIPPGYVLVPKEPTEAMINAMHKAFYEGNRSIWQAMLEAAPKPQGEQP